MSTTITIEMKINCMSPLIQLNEPKLRYYHSIVNVYFTENKFSVNAMNQNKFYLLIPPTHVHSYYFSDAIW